jgi:hypothetical protein
MGNGYVLYSVPKLVIQKLYDLVKVLERDFVLD